MYSWMYVYCMRKNSHTITASLARPTKPLLIGHNAHWFSKAKIIWWTDLLRIYHHSYVRYNEDVAKTMHSEMKNGPVCLSLCVGEQYVYKGTATDSQQLVSYYIYRTLTDIHINTQYISTAYTHSVTTHMSCSLELAIFCTATWHHSPPDSSVCGCALWRRDLSPSVLSVEEERDGKEYYTRGVKMKT